MFIVIWKGFRRKLRQSVRSTYAIQSDLHLRSDLHLGCLGTASLNTVEFNLTTLWANLADDIEFMLLH